jgi:hypothetical protein
MKTVLPHRLTILAAAVALLGVPALRSQTLDFNVNINTAGMSVDSANAPFYLDFGLNYGSSASATSTAVLSNFAFTGGGAVGSAVPVSGSATGNFTSTVTLTADSASPTNELYQEFGTGVTNISFNAAITEPDTAANEATSTYFTAAILDSEYGTPGSPSTGLSAATNALLTSANDVADLVTLTLASSNTVANVATWTALYSSAGDVPITGVTATAASAVPEPATSAVWLGGAVVLFAFGVRRFRAGRKAATLSN